jgi:hypothetical protein
MNERIKELAEQASKEAFPVGSMAWMETFAELIVQKCADIGALNADGNFAVYNSIVEYFGMQEPEE